MSWQQELRSGMLFSWGELLREKQEFASQIVWAIIR